MTAEELPFRLELCGRPARLYLVEDGGQHDRPITRCASRIATPHEQLLWFCLFPPRSPIHLAIPAEDVIEVGINSPNEPTDDELEELTRPVGYATSDSEIAGDDALGN